MSHHDRIHAKSSTAGRRSFLTRFTAIVISAILVVFPFGAGWGVLSNPLRRRRNRGNNDALDTAGFARICPLDSLPADGQPHEFVVTADVADAWARAPSQRVGSVFLARTEAGGKPQVAAFTATCPHLGCAVEFDSAEDRFKCPCHESAFAKDGEKLFGPSLRGLDPLDVRLVDDNGTQQVWVDFQRFRAGIAERIPVG